MFDGRRCDAASYLYERRRSQLSATSDRRFVSTKSNPPPQKMRLRPRKSTMTSLPAFPRRTSGPPFPLRKSLPSSPFT